MKSNMISPRRIVKEKAIGKGPSILGSMRFSVYYVILIGFFLHLGYSLPNFTGAEGWGTDTKGGRGGKVLIVSNLKSSGPGSFAEAMMTTGPRIIVFQVSGVIENSAIKPLTEDNSFVTVAGQTSPGGITLKTTEGTGIEQYRTNFHDAVFRFIRFRGNGNYDNISFNISHNIVFDHCDFSGASDEAFDITFSHDITVSWCTIANSGKGQTYGALIAYAPTSNISLHHNVFAHHVHRGGPHFHWAEQKVGESAYLQFINNVSYDNKNCRFLDASEPLGTLYWNFVGNYYKAGPTTGEECSNGSGPVNIPGGSQVYAADNFWIQKNSTVSKTTEGVFDIRYSTPDFLKAPLDMPIITSQPVEESFVKVLAEVGAWPRDNMNKRTIQEIKDGTGGLNKLDDALITSGPEPLADSDKDGMPDEWEKAKGLSATDGSDYNGDLDKNGYTNIEDYINEQALLLLGKDPTSPTERILHNYINGTKLNLEVFPQFIKNGTSIEITLNGSSILGDMNIFNSNGKIVMRIPANKYSRWDGCDKSGKFMESGLYYLVYKPLSLPIMSKKIFVYN